MDVIQERLQREFDLGLVISAPSVKYKLKLNDGTTVDVDNPNLEGRYTPWRGYGQSKLANYHFALGLQRELEARDLRAQSLVAHPGLTATNLQRHTVDQGGGGFVGTASLALVNRAGMDAARGALPQLRAATDPGARGGEMYAPRFINSGAAVRRPILRRVGLTRAIDKLWAVSLRETGVPLDIDGALAGI